MSTAAARPRTRIRGSIASALDGFVADAILKRGGRSAAESFNAERRIDGLRRLLAIYGDPGFIASPDSFFAPPETLSPATSRVRASGRSREMVDLAWESGYRPFSADVGERYLEPPRNRTAHARLFAHRRVARAAVVLIHGYGGGVLPVEQRLWPIRWLARNGLDVALTVLPFHGMRRSPRAPSRVAFPDSDPRITIEGFRQAVWDLRVLVRRLRERGAEQVGVMGMSLGGYTSALFASVERELAFVVPVIPLASLADFARERGRFNGSPAERTLQHELLESVFHVVSPLSRPCLVDPAARLVIAGVADRITPIAHARRLAEHLSAPLEIFEGGHLLQLGRAAGFRAAGRMLRERGIFA